MTQPTHAELGLVRLGDSDFVSANPGDDLRGKAVYDQHGQRMGSVHDLYVDRQERRARLVEVRDGGFLGILGPRKKSYLVPVEAITGVTEGRVTVEPGRTERAPGPAPFNAKVKPPSAGDRGGIHAPFPFGRR